MIKTYCIMGLHFASLASAAAATETCPAVIDPSALHVKHVPDGWSSFVSAPLYLHSAAPMSGPPEQRGELAGFTQQRIGGKWVYTYDLRGRFPEGKWLACLYGESDQVTLAKRLRDDVRSCSITHRKGRYAGQYEVGIVCQ